MFQEIPKSYRYSYARISSKSQEENSYLESQKQELLSQRVSEKNIRVQELTTSIYFQNLVKVGGLAVN
jgi:hypothetical protein